MLAGGTYLQINFGNLTFIDGISLTVPGAFAPIRTIRLGFSWDGMSFALDPTTYSINGSSSYSISLVKPLALRYLRIYILDVMQSTDLLTKTTGFILNMTGIMNSTNVTVASKSNSKERVKNEDFFIFADVCPSVSSSLVPRSILVAPSTGQSGLTYAGDVYVCDETPTRFVFFSYFLDIC